MSRNCGCSGVELPTPSTLTDAEIKKLLEEVNALLKDTQAQILCQNGKIAETITYIKDNLSLALQSLLDSMEASGEIDQLILDTITNYGNKLEDMEEYFNTKSLHLDFNRVFRHMAVSRGNRVANDSKNNTTAFAQGITQTDTTLIFGEVCNYNYNNNAHFVEVNKSDYSIKREFDLENVGHVSALGYNKCNNEFYVLPFYYNTNGSTTRTNDLLIYNYNTMEFKKKVVLSVNIAGFTVDNQTNTMYGATATSVYKIYDNFTMVKLFDYEGQGTIQGIAVYDNYMYIAMFNGTYIEKFDMTGNVVCNIPIERYYGFYYTGEPEGITIDEDGNLYMVVCSYNAYSYYFCNQIFKTNVKENTAIVESRSGNAQSILAINVGNPTSNNPDGTADNPYGTICEAILCLNSPTAQSMGLIRVNILVDCSNETFFYRNGRVILMGNNNQLGQINISDSEVYINAVNVVNPSDMLQNHNTYLGRCRGVIYSITSTQNYGPCNLNLEYSQIRIVNATCNGSPTEGRIKAIGGTVDTSITSVNEAIYGNSQLLQKVTKAFTSVTPLTITKEQIYQLGNTFTNLQMFCSLTEDSKVYYSGMNVKLTGPDMEGIKNGSMSKLISVDFATQNGAYMITCTLDYNNGTFLLKDFTSYKVTGDGNTVGTKQFTILAMTMN